MKLKRDLESLIGDLLAYLDRRNRGIIGFCDYSATLLRDYSATLLSVQVAKEDFHKSRILHCLER